MTSHATREPVWWLRTTRPDELVVHGFVGSGRVDGSVMSSDQLPPGTAVPNSWSLRARMSPATRQVLALEIRPSVVGAVDLVYVERVERDADPVRVELIAFEHCMVAGRAESLAQGAGAAPVVAPAAGTVLTLADAARLGLGSADQLAAVRWYPATGRVREVYVTPTRRRAGIGTTVLFAAESVCAARGWPHLRGDGVRTDMGEALVSALRWGVGRFAARTHVAPPMTPGT